MEIAGEKIIKASRNVVWGALMDPDVLARCIPGCEALTATGPDAYTAVVAVKVGPISARFRGSVTLEDKQPPESCRIVGSGSGGAVGFAKGVARVTLTQVDEMTEVAYAVDVDTGGKIASLGARMMRRVAEENVDRFFDCLAQAISSTAPAAVAGATAIAPNTMAPQKLAPSSAPNEFRLLDRLAWLGAGIGVALVGLLLTGKL